MAVPEHLHDFLILLFLTFSISSFFVVMLTNSYRMTCVFPSASIILVKMIILGKEHVLLAKLEDESQENFDGELEAK